MSEQYKKNIHKTSTFKADFKQYKGDVDVCEKLTEAMHYIGNGLPMPPEFKNHPLKGNFKPLWDCHLFPNIVLLYSFNDSEVSLARIGSHNKLRITEILQKPLKLHIKESWELTESNRPNVFNNNSRETYGDLINPNSKVGNVTTHDYYKFEKGKDAILTYMTGDGYINKCIYDIFKSNYDKTVTNSVDWDKVDKYAELMKQGVKFPTPYLDYVNKGQEGRHRALAFKQAFGKDAEMPVIEIYPSNPTLDEIYEYCETRWHDGDLWMEYVAPNFGYTTKEIYDYLGKEYIEQEEPKEEIEPDDLDNIDDLLDDEDLINSDTDSLGDFFNFASQKLNRKITDIDDMSNTEFDKLVMQYSKVL